MTATATAAATSALPGGAPPGSGPTGLEPVPGLEPAPQGASRTLRRLTLWLVALVVLGLAAGVSAVTSVQTRAGFVDELTTRGGPLVVAAQDLYRSLSDADATAASAFLTDGPEPPELRERYQIDIANAGAALARAASGVNEGPAAAAVAAISTQLPVYTGLVETARSANRLGLPVGAAYLREASGVMRDQLLPAAQQLFEAVSEQRDEARDSAGRFPWFAMLLGLLLLACLVILQGSLTRRTNRLFNVGLLVASGAALASMLWLLLSWGSASGHLDASDRDGSAQVALLAEARITALQARSDEAHTLVARGAGSAYEDTYQQAVAELTGGDQAGEGGAGGLLGEAREQASDEPSRAAVGAASEAAAQWQEIHAEVRRLDADGDYPAAVGLAIGLEPGSAAGAFGRLDEALGEGIAYGNDRFASEAEQAGGALGGVGIGLGLLAGLLLIGAVVGIQQRRTEYR
jgi:hypothetical protein